MFCYPTHRRVLALTWVATALAGCGSEPPVFDPAATYTSESLAAELVLRYKDLDPARRNQSKPAAAKRVATKDAKEATTKDAQATTLDDLINEVAAKADFIPGTNRPEALRKVAEAVAKDGSVAPDDRKTIADRVRTAAGNP